MFLTSYMFRTRTQFKQKKKLRTHGRVLILHWMNLISNGKWQGGLTMGGGADWRWWPTVYSTTAATVGVTRVVGGYSGSLLLLLSCLTQRRWRKGGGRGLWGSKTTTIKAWRWCFPVVAVGACRWQWVVGGCCLGSFFIFLGRNREGRCEGSVWVKFWSIIEKKNGSDERKKWALKIQKFHKDFIITQ